MRLTPDDKALIASTLQDRKAQLEESYNSSQTTRTLADARNIVNAIDALTATLHKVQPPTNAGQS